jgi:flagellar basal-body rod protein FlgC
MGLFDAIDVAGSGLSAERLRMDITSENLANAQTTKGADGQPYRRKTVVLAEAGDIGPTRPSFGSALNAAMTRSVGNAASPARGVQVAGIVQDSTPLKRIYDPGHPDADKNGYVTMPNVNTVTEMTDLISSSRAYEANVTAMQTAKTMFTKTLDLLR